MTGRLGKPALLAMLVALASWAQAPAHAAAPEVTNVVAAQRDGEFVVDISYDLVDIDSGSVWVALMISTDGGATFGQLCRNVTGDVGPDVVPGPGKQIVWQARRDVPGLQIPDAVVRVVADDAPYPTIPSWYRIDALGNATAFAAGDTIGFGTPLRLAWAGWTPAVALFSPERLAELDTIYPYDDGLLGYKWQLLGELGGNCLPDLEDCWHPRKFNEATGDSFSYFGELSELNFRNDGSSTTNPFRKLLPSGVVALRVNTVDVVGNEVLPGDQDFSFVVNHDPETVLLDGETDWAHPEDPQVYPYYYLLNDPTMTRIPFRSGERIPDRSYVVFKALGRDDPRDMPLRTEFPGGLTGSFTAVRENLTGGEWWFATDASELDTLPAWSAGFDGWYADTLGFMVGPRMTFTVQMKAVDEHGRRDGTPAELDFAVGYPPCAQCVELLPKTSSTSAFPPDLACQDPGGAPNACFQDTARYYLSDSGLAPDELQRLQTGFIAVEKTSGFTEIVTDTVGWGRDHYIVAATLYNLKVLLHGRDDPREAWPQATNRVMGWRYQVDYECDPYNQIKDGGGVDDIGRFTWGEATDGSLVVEPGTGLWSMDVVVAAPTLLFSIGPNAYWNVLYYTVAEQDTATADLVFTRSLAQMGAGAVSAVALDQSSCGAYPVRPTRYNYFRGVRPTALNLPAGRTWRDCDLAASGVVPGIKGSLDLALSAMESSLGEPVIKHFRLAARVPGGTVDCTAPPPHP